jgi:hypothetical protein
MMSAKEILEDVKEFSGLMESIEDLLQGEKLDNIVPALVTLLGEAGWMSGMGKESFVEYVKNAVEDTYVVMEKVNGKRPCRSNH